MANFDGFTPTQFGRFCSLFEEDDVTAAPLGVAAVCRNNRWHVTSCGSRYGVNQQVGQAWVGLNTNKGFPITGAECFKYSGNGVVPDKQVPVLFDQNGNLLLESPVGSGTLVPIVSGQVTPGAGTYMEAAQTLNRAFMAFTNIANPAVAASVNAVYDLNSGILDPLSMRPVGETFKAGETYRVGECVTPILASAGGNGLAAGRLFRVSAITTGIAGNVEPVWPNTDGGAVVSGGVTFTENTPVYGNVISSFAGFIDNNGNLLANGGFPNIGIVATASKNAGAGAFAAGRDIYVGLSIVNGFGESGILNGGPILAVSNTVLNDQLQIKITTALRQWVQNLTGGAAVVGFNLYVADVATGAAPPAIAALGKDLAGPFSCALNSTALVNSSPAGSGTSNNTISPGVGDVTEDIVPTITPGKTVNVNGKIFFEGAGGTLLPVAGGTTGGVPTSYSDFLVNATGNVDPGPRYAIVLFVNRNGYISGYGANFFVRCDTGISGLQIQMFNIPIGPPETAQRIVAFTQSGGTQVGPFAYIPENDSQNGIPITSTVINDNVTTTAIFNFTDIYLEELMATNKNVTTFFDKIKLPPLRTLTYSETLDRMIYLPYILPSGAYFSLPGEPESVFESTGGLEISETDGQQLMGVIDYGGVIYGLKEASGHEVHTSSADPADWTYTKRWDKVGPCGLRAYDVGLHFVIFVHRSGVYVFMGDKPRRLTKELPVTWGRVNWAAGQTIWVKIDDETREIHIGVPLDRATVPSHTLTLNFEESVNLDPPVHSTIYSKGKFISTAAARKWSIQDIAANSAVRVNRTVLNGPAQFDSATLQSQLWFASAFDGAVRAQTPGIYTDDGNTINWTVETVCPGEALKQARLGGAQALLSGNGAISVTVLAGSVKATADGGVNNRQTEIKLKDAYVKPGLTTDYKCGASGVNERFRLRFSTAGKAPGTWADLKSAILYTNPLFTAKAN